MRLNVAIVEDNDDFKNLLINYLERYQNSHDDVKFNIFHFKDGSEIIDEYNAIYDIIFMDIELKYLDGMSTAQKIRTFDNDVIIIFVTNMAGYAIKGYSVNALSFILKPISYFAFKEELKKTLEKLRVKKDFFITIPIDSGQIKLNANDILFIESSLHYVIIQTKETNYQMRSTMKKMEELLFERNFVRCDNSYLVNLFHIDSVVDNIVYVDEYRLKISRPRKKHFMEALASYMGG